MMNKMVRRNNQPQKRSGTEAAATTPTFLPRVDIRETDDAVNLIADMPGVDEKNVSINVERNTLTIRGEFNALPPEGYSLTYGEYRVGNYEREFTLSDDVDRDSVEAKVSNGVLRMRLPKAQQAQPRRIEVKAG